MSDDGADLGVGADRALKTVLGGGRSPEPEEQRTPEQLREHIETHRGPSGYESSANEACHRILLTYEARPEAVQWPAEPEGHIEKGPENGGMGRWVHDGPDLYTAVKEQTDGLGDVSMSDLGLTGFQWGWAVNAAKYIVGAPPVPNPAILTVG